VPYAIFEGTHTLTPVLSPPSVVPEGNYGLSTCVDYIKEIPGGCDGFGLSLGIRFTLMRNQTLVTTWRWSGRDNTNRCITAYGSVPRSFLGAPVSNICGGPKGLLAPDAQFILRAENTGTVGLAAFDFYID
jgi:hypothetical protein